ncbi:sensor histidine kinase [Azospirillum sp.]|uniref:sensor histidine kinase n=1 Tax=Azospirillum sp. TaxID=34012 RepID=UPI003D71A2FB
MPDRDGPATNTAEELLASRELFEGILAIAADAVVSVDQAQRIILFNQGAERIFQFTAAEALGQPLEILLPTFARAGHSRQVERFGHTGVQARQMGERSIIRGRRKNGEEFPAEASISRIVVGGRTVFTAILRDVTQAREAEEAINGLNADLRRRATQLENANRELEAFSYSVSHDLRAPLRSISGFSQVLTEDYSDCLDEEGRDYLKRIGDASQRMAQLIDDLLDLSRLSRGEVRRAPVDLSALATAVIADLVAANPGRRVAVDIAPGLKAEADPHLVRTVLVNLLGNAWKYTSRKEHAHIVFGATTDEEGQPAFFVRDDGAGFDMAYADKLFGAFQRLHGMKDFPGTGVGLATVQRIVHKHGGRVWAEGVVDGGATFYFTLQ